MTASSPSASERAAALAWFRENPDYVADLADTDRAGQHSVAVLVRAALADAPVCPDCLDSGEIEDEQLCHCRRAAAVPAGDNTATTTETRIPEREWRRREALFLAREVVNYRSDDELRESKIDQLAAVFQWLDESRTVSPWAPVDEQDGAQT